MKTYAVILAAGIGKRFKDEIPKQFVKIAGRYVIEYTVEIFQKHPKVDSIVIVTLPEYIKIVEELIVKNIWTKCSKVLIGGETRQESSYIGINAINEKESYVLIHAAARPFVDHRIITEVIEKLEKGAIAVDVAIPTTDIIIKIKENIPIIEEIPDRKYLMRGQTPQGFRLSVIRKAHTLAREDGIKDAMDDCSLVLRYNLGPVYVVRGSEENIKITHPLDIYIAEKIFQIKMTRFLHETHVKEQLKGKVGIVFGASRGIGKSIVQIAENLGCRIYGFSRKNGVNIIDRISISKALDLVYKQEGRIDFVINTSAILVKKPFMNYTIEEIEEQIKINYIGAINVARESFHYLKGGGHLLFFTCSSYTRGKSYYSIYSSTKAAIVNLVQALSEEFYPFGIKVNAICPERTATPMRFENFGKEPLDSLLQPEKVALVSLQIVASDITGCIIEVKRDYEFFGHNV